MHDEQLRPVVDKLLATRRAKVEDTQGGARKGLRVLFTSHSGRNKLLAAQLFAHELAVDLFEIDLQRLVSKYIGDTEKNLDALFKAAEASDAVLLFSAQTIANTSIRSSRASATRSSISTERHAAVPGQGFRGFHGPGPFLTTDS
jgi:SpoVK/Ycf46/Vps4 family AAA+-type ATPase